MSRKVVTPEQLDALAADYAPPAPPPPAPPPKDPPPRPSPSSLRPTSARRCAAYLRKVGPAISGQHGHDRTYMAARLIWNDFGVDEAEGFPILQEFNATCQPPWSDKDLRHKWDDAAKAGPGPEGRGYRLCTDRPGWDPPAGEPRPAPSANGHHPPAAPPASGPQTGTKPPLPLVYYAEITPALDAADFVEGLLLDGAMSVVYGESGCGKTFFMLDLALHVAGGLTWCGRHVEARGVLYLALEGSHGIRNRIAAFKLANAANAAELPLAVVPVALDLLSPEGDTLRVVEAAKTAAARLAKPVGLVVVDTLSRALAGGNENASEDMGALVRHLDLIRQVLPAHLSVVHHSGKDAARGARGHSLLRAATDTEIEVSRDHLAKTSLARVTKQRELELGDEFAFRLHPVELGRDRRGRPVCSCVVRQADRPTASDKDLRRIQKEQEAKAREQREEKFDEDEVLRVVREELGRGAPAASLTWIGTRAKCPRKRAEAAVERLCERGELVRTGQFTKPSGKGAATKVDVGYALPKDDGPSEDDR